MTKGRIPPSGPKPATWDLFYEQSGGRLYGWAKKIGAGVQDFDYSGEMNMTLAKLALEYSEVGNPVGWVLRVFTNQLKDQIRKNERTVPTVPILQESSEGESYVREPSQPDHQEEVLVFRGFVDVLTQLTPEYQEVLLLTCAGFKPAEIAKMSGESSGAVRVRLNRARVQYRIRIAGKRVATPVQLITEVQ
ncbi:MULTISPECIES: RNA polymerase sigma factor [unclassified Streptomyces]|uniref:sigma-70 family RNA polymerase sigma factor n=1 Tax=unclassified Streptomyces TaxID=2593676 RepID=UPI002DDB648B|nr:RNA polymerase sigma factor [Streptomyces sp. NBC_00243]WRZ17010.1 RNA polymerase sigma factor [Streptomyces sp. NBC_00243]WRZ25654.1 RNA polymerase sigma factor [Streptomyces sp. NBC_00243]